MTYIEGFVLAVPTANKEKYRRHAEDAAPIFAEHGVRRMVEAWGDDVQPGKVTDFYKAVQAKDGETIVFSWFEYPDRATRDSANEKIMNDPRMKAMGEEMPFDGQRMIISGFSAFLDEGDSGPGGYFDGILLPVSESKREAYHSMATRTASIFLDHKAVRVVEAWGDDLLDGKVTDFKKAVKAEPGESVVFSWIEWPDKSTRDEAWKAIMSGPDMNPDGEMPFDGLRMFWGGFVPIVDRSESAPTLRSEPQPA